LAPGETAAPTSVPTATPTVFRHPEKLDIRRFSDESVTIDRGAKAAARATFRFRPVPGAVSYRFWMKRALPMNLSAMSDQFWNQQAASDANETGTFNFSDQSAGTMGSRARASPI
jgi:hypothetical protein